MIKILAILAFLPSIAYADGIAAYGEGTHRMTFEGHDADSRADACKMAKDQANGWLDRSQLVALNTTSTSKGECDCDKPPSKIIKNVCPGGTPICDASRLIDQTVEFPWHCIVDATVTNTRK